MFLEKQVNNGKKHRIGERQGWVNTHIILGFSFFICKMGLMTVSTS
jgi:hypothetical protein